MTPRVRRALDGGRVRDREVLDAAINIFWEKGYSGTSVQDVADALGMLKGSLYYYIDSKEDLLEMIFSDSHDEVQKITDEVLALDLDPGTRLGPSWPGTPSATCPTPDEPACTPASGVMPVTAWAP